MSRTMRPFLIFRDGHAPAATTLHASLLPDRQILDVARLGAGGAVNPA